MDVLQAIKGRYSCRQFKDRPVTKETIEKILDVARWSPSGANTQPWEVAVVMGDAKDKLVEFLLKNIDETTDHRQEFNYYPEKWSDPYKTRRFECGMALYKALNISREDKEARTDKWFLNYRFFNAPVGLFFFVDKSLGDGAVLDTGNFMQSFMLSARSFGLESCAQAALSYFPDLIKGHLGIDSNKKLVCGMSVGYPDKSALVNTYRTDRVPAASFTKWYE